MKGDVADEKFRLLLICVSGSNFDVYAFSITVFAVPGSPRSKTGYMKVCFINIELFGTKIIVFNVKYIKSIF